ncbi:DUF1972 domain-containing protein [Amantichitinum ursilacus]|uniref:Glycosyl transferases group 1 n=1 Tax=Amantichitinum ursilacus TaxID=857265 RepID=A0A0N0GMR0_9NEIS|nr:DUF1972 domain-containing protein [Amantichitinum ursilacus]KPC51829.1 Glycosyl transferases group 1 [Amantichitinum ursilacus]
MDKKISILGIRGVPAAHGGFETFAEFLALYLTAQGWKVTVYCQHEGNGPITEDEWRGVRRINIPVAGDGAKSTIIFDWISTKHAAKVGDLCLTLGYNTAIFCAWLRLRGVNNVINMDGIEWKRAKWGIVAKTWFWMNEWAGSFLGNHLVADHPEIKKHLARGTSESRITMIPYGADRVASYSDEVLARYDLQPGQYGLLIARAEPENSILEVVRAWSRQQRGMPLVVLGNYKPDEHAYHREVKTAAGPEVRFVGAIYDKNVVSSLRAGCRFYVHGHQVGGTNPSLVEALGAGNAVLGHDNRFNRWVAAGSGVYFANEAECAERIEELVHDDKLVAQLQVQALAQFRSRFEWTDVLAQYETLLAEWLPQGAALKSEQASGAKA